MRKPKLPNVKSINSRSSLPQADADDILFKHATQLSEMFDGVVILATRVNRDGTTQICQVYEGNAFTTRGLIEHANATFEPCTAPEDEDDDND